MLLMVEKETRDGKDYDKSKGSPYLKYWDVNNLYDWAMSEKLPVNCFEFAEDIFEFSQNEEKMKEFS